MTNYKLQIKEFIYNLKFIIYHSMRRSAGFTLLELLVVVSIMTILITMSISSFATAQMKGRDARRKSDIKDVQTALEQYYSVCGFRYPTPSGTFFSPVTCTSPSIAILPTVPSDPKSGATPYYCSGVACTSSAFTICAALESDAATAFCVSNQQ